MKNRICELEANLEMIKVVERTLYAELVEAARNVITENITTPNNAQIHYITVRDNLHGSIEIAFELSFYNPETGTTNFGSDVWFEYNLAQGLGINYGTIGTFTKQDTYQFKRIELLHHVVTNIESIESEFKKVCMSSSEYMNKRNERYRANSELEKAKAQLEKINKLEIERSLESGCHLLYNNDVSSSIRLFYDNEIYHLQRDGDTIDIKDYWTIVRVNPKTVRLINLRNTETVNVNKEALIHHISTGYIQLKK